MQLNTKCNNLDPAECRYNMEPEKQTFSPGNPEILLVRWPSGPGPTGGIYHVENSRKCSEGILLWLIVLSRNILNEIGRKLE